MKNILHFLKELKENNNREWFNENKEMYNKTKAEYEKMIQFLIMEIGKFDKQVQSLDVKDCFFRIYRDIRFSGDKTPYKSHFGAYFANGGRKSKFAGYYFHIENDGSFISTGLHMPEPEILKAVREEINDNYDEFSKLINKSDFKKNFPEIQGDKLKTIPKGFDKNNEAAEFLKLKSFYTVHSFTNEEILKPDFLNKVVSVYKTSYNYNQFFNKIIENF